ncbi:non-hydrolyzing UDP-N-acetylglucosamine 2-epimerase [Nitrosophilus kaiyonis]|uniref:non-hydrolyzing UDP-N-acetylglucosamine 2-epimerase n=1 Tax=Nitrosophilus kaiyonis TaxID=2930200 RepID=UPI002490E886|nr:UDP-N-acetylglucosamine 2-epimerase (non-hydrolyzing) [Nitrosophilus kaiyonis]
MKKILVTFGTRPEAIKLAPIIKELNKNDEFIVKVCITAQHREMLDNVLKIFNIKADYDLDIMKQDQDLYDITSNILIKMKDILNEFEPDLVIVHGDTTTTFAVTLAGFYKKIDVAHVEAGLRTYNIYSPWPEEANRRLTSILTKYHFAPTKKAKENLINEGIKKENIIVTGNSVVDALLMILNKIEKDKNFKKRIESNLFIQIPKDVLKSKFILVTGHRRENFGRGFQNICNAIKEIALKNKNINILYPVHLNPNVQNPVNKILKDIKNVYLLKPLDYPEFVYLMSKSFMILTDSGGIQEEAPSLKKPVLLMRETTERPEALETGFVKLVGTKKEDIVREAEKIIKNRKIFYMANNPYGDGKASLRIVNFLKKSL